MTNVIQFPNSDIRETLELEKMFDEIDIHSAEVKEAVKVMAIPYIKKYTKLQSMEIAIQLPDGVNKIQEEFINEQVIEALKKYAGKVQMEMLYEILLLVKQLCKQRINNGV